MIRCLIILDHFRHLHDLARRSLSARHARRAHERTELFSSRTVLQSAPGNRFASGGFVAGAAAHGRAVSSAHASADALDLDRDLYCRICEFEVANGKEVPQPKPLF